MPKNGKGLLDCVDCELGTRREYYMVHDEVWEAAGAPDGCLCLRCLEVRLGRALSSTDFPDIPVNRLGGQTRRLRELLAK